MRTTNWYFSRGVFDDFEGDKKKPFFGSFEIGKSTALCFAWGKVFLRTTAAAREDWAQKCLPPPKQNAKTFAGLLRTACCKEMPSNCTAPAQMHKTLRGALATSFFKSNDTRWDILTPKRRFWEGKISLFSDTTSERRGNDWLILSPIAHGSAK